MELEENYVVKPWRKSGEEVRLKSLRHGLTAP